MTYDALGEKAQMLDKLTVDSSWKGHVMLVETYTSSGILRPRKVEAPGSTHDRGKSQRVEF